MSPLLITRLAAALVVLGLLSGCATVVSSATSGLSENLSAAILNQDDPETVRDGAPAFLLMLDSFVAGSPDESELFVRFLQDIDEDPSTAMPRLGTEEPDEEAEDTLEAWINGLE